VQAHHFSPIRHNSSSTPGVDVGGRHEPGQTPIMTALSIERATTFQAADVAAMLHLELLRGLVDYASNVDALGLERVLDAEMGREDLAHLHEARRLVGMLHDHLRSPSGRSSSADPASLTRREIEVLEGVAHGLCTAEIAASLHISRNTVRNHVQNILAKLSVHTRLQAVTHALGCGLIQPPTRSDGDRYPPRN
jgi:DNA-binding CsgD family transcriptional regulator